MVYYHTLVNNWNKNKLMITNLYVIMSFFGVPGMAWIQLEINQPQVFTAKCSEPQAVDSDVMGEGSGVAILLSVRTETWWG